MEFFVKENDLSDLKKVDFEKACKLFLKSSTKLKKGNQIKSIHDAIPYLNEKLKDQLFESIVILYLNETNQIMKMETTDGVENQAPIFPKKIVRTALLNYSTGIMMAHNHPTGQTKPSLADTAITRMLIEACKTLDIRFLDHIIIGNGYFSFRENGLI